MTDQDREAEMGEYRGIEGLVGRRGVDAAVSVGRKLPNGNIDPGSKDRFWIVMPHEDGSGTRPPHPDFAAFNGAPAERRKTLYGNLCHATEAELFEYGRRAPKLPAPWTNHPDRRPACVGNGVKALRYFGREEVEGPRGGLSVLNDFREINCPGDACEYSQGGKPPCKSHFRFWFRVSWPQTESGLRPAQVVLASKSWNNVAVWRGFFDRIEQFAKDFRLREWSLFGLPIKLTLVERTKPSIKARYPTIQLTEDCDLVEFFADQRRHVEAAGGESLRQLVTGAQDPREQEDEVVAGDFAMITPGHVTKPAMQAQPGPAAESGSVVEDAEYVDDAEPDPEPVESFDDLHRRLLGKAHGLGLTDVDLSGAIQHVTNGGALPDLGPGDDAKVEAELQRLARGKR